LFSNNYYLRNYSLISNSYNLVREGFHSARGVAYNHNKSVIYVLDAGSSELLSLKRASGDEENGDSSGTSPSYIAEVLIKDLVGDERGIAFDWIGQKIYYLSSTRLYVCDSSCHSRTTLLNESVLQEATTLVLDPFAGYLFFTDWHYPPFIGRLGMDGTNFTKIVTQDIGTPIGLAIDRITKRIWWTDTHLKRIEFSDYNGRNRFVAVGSDQTAYPFAIAFYDGLIYWTDRANHSIYSADALNGTNKTVVVQGTIHSAFSLEVYHYSLQKEGN
jgi:DNA-binding beta-propeller fold protein YncE